MEEEIKFMNATPELVFGLEDILDELVKDNEYQAQIGNTTILYEGTLEDTANGKREVFRIIRKRSWQDGE